MNGAPQEFECIAVPLLMIGGLGHAAMSVNGHTNTSNDPKLMAKKSGVSALQLNLTVVDIPGDNPCRTLSLLLSNHCYLFRLIYLILPTQVQDVTDLHQQSPSLSNPHLRLWNIWLLQILAGNRVTVLRIETWTLLSLWYAIWGWWLSGIWRCWKLIGWTRSWKAFPNDISGAILIMICTGSRLAVNHIFIKFNPPQCTLVSLPKHTNGQS